MFHMILTTEVVFCPDVRRYVSSAVSLKFQLLVSVFSKQFLSNSDKHFHLGNFYALLPALTVSHVETLVAAKERITKKKGRLEEENVFMDDGFAMGEQGCRHCQEFLG